METRTVLLNKKFPPLQRSISPWVNKLHVHLDIFPEKESPFDLRFHFVYILSHCMLVMTEFLWVTDW